MAWTRRTVVSIATVTGLAAAALGMGAAVAQDGGVGTRPAELIERLGELEMAFPEQIPPTEVAVAPSTTGGSLLGDATSVRAVLDTLEPDLRTLYVDADAADGEVAEAVAHVTRGWLDVWSGTGHLSAAESHDLGFPAQATDDQGAAAGADELRGRIDAGLEIVLQARERHLEGYVALRDLNLGERVVQARFRERAAAAEEFHAEQLPEALAYLSAPSEEVVVPTQRFATDSPGVRSRATSMTVVCVDREAMAELGGVATDEVLVELVGPDETGEVATGGPAPCPG